MFFLALKRSSISDTDEVFFEKLEVEKTFKVKTKEKEDKKLKRAIHISYFLFFQKVFLKYLKLGTNFDYR